MTARDWDRVRGRGPVALLALLLLAGPAWADEPIDAGAEPVADAEGVSDEAAPERLPVGEFVREGALGDYILLDEIEPSPRRSEFLLPDGTTPENVLHRLEMERGKSTVLRTSYAVKRVGVGNPNVVDFVVLGLREIQLVAKAVGETNVLIWDKNGRLQSSVDVHVGAIHAQVLRELQRVLQNPAVSVDMAGESIVLRGAVGSLEQSEKAVEVARAFFSQKDRQEGTEVINLLEVGGNHQVMIEVIIAEMARTLRRDLGVNFAAKRFGDARGDFQLYSLLDGLTSAPTEDLFGAASVLFGDQVNIIARMLNSNNRNISVAIQALQQEGLAKILAEPTLVARSGELASFLVGGEVPIPVAQGTGNNVTITIEYKKFGVSVDFIPTVLSPDRIHLQITPEVSEPDFSFAVSTSAILAPAFVTRRASTGIELADGQSFVIAGLLRDDVTSIVDKFPGLGDVPVLGALFRSTSFLKRQSELVLIVRPRLVQPLGSERIALPTDHYIEPNFFELFGLGRLEALGQSPDAPPMDGRVRMQDEEDRRGGLVGEFGPRVPVPAPTGE